MTKIALPDSAIDNILTPEKRLEAELKNAKPREKTSFGDGKGATVMENFISKDQQTRNMKAQWILQNAYPGYQWLVRSIGNDRRAIDSMGIGIGLRDLFDVLRSHGINSGAVMYLNPKDWFGKVNQEDLFAAQVKKLGGELLERARLARGRKLADQSVDKLPEGFEQFVKAPKYRTVETVEEAKQLIEAHIKAEEQPMETVKDSRDIKDDNE